MKYSRPNKPTVLSAVAALGASVAVLAPAQPSHAADTPPNPIGKPGYFLTANDEFNVDNVQVTPDLWNSKYLPHWTDVDSSAKYDINNGSIKLKVQPDSVPWDPEKDQETVVSGIQTAEKDWLHNWAGYTSIDHHEETRLQHIQKYGYFEIRAKTQIGGGIHSAWWMIGAQQDQVNGGSTKQSGEIDIFEVKGLEPNVTKYNWIPWGDPQPGETYNVDVGADTTQGFHVYGFDWTPTSMTLYFDGRPVKTINKSPDYPMLTLLGLYEKRHGGWTGPFDPTIPYPKQFEIDYWRAYQKIPTLPYTVELDDSALYGSARSSSVSSASGGRLVGWLGQGHANRAVYSQLYAPSAGARTLTLRYASTEDRNLTYRINGGTPVTVSLPSSGSWTTFVTRTLNVNLNAGPNKIEFWNDTGWAPDLDTITVN